jgi:hypothetical protein
MMKCAAYKDAEYEATREIPVEFLCGIQVKNQAHRGLRGRAVLAAWVNLETGL